ncbi:NAD(P)/FAD-dependent oxidoreductase [Ornithinimicrobium cavernae]|uniref:NAD(P)/FAD-dependent oxidoreductase n=1 Tax=Ornithinimicrobium cavernae TaxID=2666047 RepID=UPI00137A6DC7|nr:FAD-dependent oxidoreductase [Ornithinimicrobium cavernae]
MTSRVQWAGAAPRDRADVIVVGAGAVGAATAAELSRRGRSVLVLDRGPDWAAGASWGNAGLLCPSHAGPWASTADVAQGIRWMTRPDSPLGVRPQPVLVPFLGRLLAMSASRVAESRSLSRELCLQSLGMHEELAAEADTGFRRDGLLDTYWTEAGLARGHAGAAEHLTNGVTCQVLDRDAVREAEPHLAEDVVGGVLFPDEAHCEPAAYVRAEADRAVGAGTRFVGRAEVLDADSSSRDVRLRTTQGTFAADEVVVAAGSWSRPLARRLGTRLDLQPGKGYTVDLTAGERAPLQRPLMLQEARVAVTPLQGRLRLAGTMEFAGFDDSINRRRVDAVLRSGGDALPAWSAATVQRIWSGFRPCTPDGLPLIGRLPGEPRITLATGHAMLGLTLAPVTGVLVADLLDERPDPRLAALAPTRGGWSR